MFHIYALFHQITSLGWYNSAVRIYFPCLNNRALPRYRLWVILCRYNRSLPLGKNTFACLFIAYNRTGLPRYEQVSLMRLLLGNTSHIIEMLFPSSSPLFYLLIFLPLSHLFFFFFEISGFIFMNVRIFLVPLFSIYTGPNLMSTVYNFCIIYQTYHRCNFTCFDYFIEICFHRTFGKTKLNN